MKAWILSPLAVVDLEILASAGEPVRFADRLLWVPLR